MGKVGKIRLKNILIPTLFVLVIALITLWTVLSITDNREKFICLAKGGFWETEVGELGRTSKCFAKTNDAGKECLSSGDCEGSCLAPTGMKAGEKTSGRCSPTKPHPISTCVSVVTNGEVAVVCR